MSKITTKIDLRQYPFADASCGCGWAMGGDYVEVLAALQRHLLDHAEGAVVK